MMMNGRGRRNELDAENFLAEPSVRLPKGRAKLWPRGCESDWGTEAAKEYGFANLEAGIWLIPAAAATDTGRKRAGRAALSQSF